MCIRDRKYAIPVLIALMHDLLITAGVYSLTGREVTTSTVAALLTILGYSLYDTIIVFDRVRENVPRMPRAAFALIVGIASGAYSSIFIASPLLTHWKEREPTWRARLASVARRNNGVVPAYATVTRGGEVVDVEPERGRGRFRRG